jgi:hypothetical protein
LWELAFGQVRLLRFAVVVYGLLVAVVLAAELLQLGVVDLIIRLVEHWSLFFLVLGVAR